MQARLEKIAPPGGVSFVCKRRRDPRFEFLWHRHPEYELTLVVRSRGKRFVGDSIADYGDGDLVLLGPDLPHTWHSEGPGRHEAIVVQFSEGFLGKDFFAAPEMLPVRRLLDRSAQGLLFGGRTRRLAARRMDGMERRAGLGRLLGLLELLAFLARSREARPLSSRTFVPSLRTRDARRIDLVFGLLTERFADRITLPEAASRAHLSVPAFSRFFKRTTGKTFVRFLNELRVGHACRRLLETDRTVAQVAFECGFNNLSNFNRRFRDIKGTSPRSWRSQFLARETPG
jgi:AraC-like DNA-binding protein